MSLLPPSAADIISAQINEVSGADDTALVVAGSFAFSYYVQSFANYNETFGALAGVTILLTWMWLSAFIVPFGGLLKR